MRVTKLDRRHAATDPIPSGSRISGSVLVAFLPGILFGDLMKTAIKIAAALAGLSLVPATASAATIGGTFYAPQYDFAEFFAATDHRNFQVVLAGNPLPGSDPNAVASGLL